MRANSAWHHNSRKKHQVQTSSRLSRSSRFCAQRWYYHFGLPPLLESSPPSDPSFGIDQASDLSESSSDYQRPQTSSLTPAMNWNNSSQSSIRTSLRGGGDLGQNRLATGFRPQAERTSNGQLSFHDVVEISDDSEVEDDSEGGILLNVDTPSRVDSRADAEASIDISDGEDGEISDHPANKAMPSSRDAKTGLQRPSSKSQHGVTPLAHFHNRSNIATPIYQIDAHRGARMLADLNPEDLERQIKYALFHLPRDQIDLSRPVICLACLSEGHTHQMCPGLLCSTCGGQTKHSSRLCPKLARCFRCGERGHSMERCKSKLRNANLEPCDFCGGADHTEVSCTQRFFPARSELPQGELQLWISCAQCGSKDHLAGDCPAYGSKPASDWSLRTYSHKKIVNLSLQTGTQAREMEAQNKGIRPEGMQIRGRGAPNKNRHPQRGQPAHAPASQFEDEDDFTTRIAGNRSRRPSPPRNHMRYGDDDRGRMNRGGDDDDYYRPPSDRPGGSNGHGSYNQGPSHDYRDRNGYRGGGSYRDDRDDRGDHNRRPRSRSPSRFEPDTWRPPLPRGPPPPVSLPARPAPPRGQPPPRNPNQTSAKKGKRGAGKGKGASAGGGTAVKPMPSAAKNAWNRGRL